MSISVPTYRQFARAATNVSVAALVLSACSTDRVTAPEVGSSRPAAQVLAGGQPDDNAFTVIVTPDQSTLEVGKSIQLAATTFNGNARPVGGDKYSWSSSDPTVAVVDDRGFVRAIGSGGPVTITAKRQSGSAARPAQGEAFVTVPARNLAWISVQSPTSQPLYDIWGSSATDIWAVGEYGTMLHYDGVTWSSVAAGIDRSVTNIWGSGPSDIWASAYRVGGGGYGIYHYNGAQWVLDNTDGNGGIWGTSPSNVWIGGDGGFLMNFNGSQWTRVSNPMRGGIGAIDGTGQNDVWAAGDGNGGPVAMHFDGTQWTASSIAGVARVWGIWVSSASDVWGVGDSGGQNNVIVRWNGTAWSIVPFPTWSGSGFLYAIWGAAPNRVWAVGTGGQMAFFDGAQWSLQSIPTSTPLYSVWGASESDVWAVGAGGTILHRTFVP